MRNQNESENWKRDYGCRCWQVTHEQLNGVIILGSGSPRRAWLPRVGPVCATVDSPRVPKDSDAILGSVATLKMPTGIAPRDELCMQCQAGRSNNLSMN
jgi:hypothetical protein